LFSLRSKMGFFELLEKLREKPENFRKKIAFAAVFIITAVIFFFWLAAFDFRFQSSSEEIKQIEKPAAVIKESILNFYGIIKENIGRFK